MLQRNAREKSSNSKDLTLLKYHKGVTEIRLCDSDESCSISGGRALSGGGDPNKLKSDNAAGGKRRYVRETQSRVPLLSKPHRLLRHLAIAAVTFMPLGLVSAPAFAGSDHPVSNISHDVANFLGLAPEQNTTTRQVISFFGFGNNQANNPTDPQPVAEQVKPAELTPRDIAPVQLTDVGSVPRLPATAAPSVETPLHRLFCVEYARMRSGLAVFGDAKHWWDHAKNIYARMSRPVEEAVMVFSGSKRLRRGHVAVVTGIVSPRQIIVDQANWENHGEIDHSTPVLDVSRDNDWSEVRVWDMHSGTFGSHVYAISGFIAKSLTTASND